MGAGCGRSIVHFSFYVRLIALFFIAEWKVRAAALRVCYNINENRLLETQLCAELYFFAFSTQYLP